MALTGWGFCFSPETSREEPFSFFLLTQRVLTLQKMLKIFLIVTVIQRNMCCYYHYNCYRCCCAICFQRRSGRMSTVFSGLLLPRAVGDSNNIFYCSSFQKVRLILAKCEKNLVLSLFYWTAVMMSIGVVHQQYFTALIAKLLCPLSRIGHACDWQAQRLSESVKAVAKSTFLHY